MAINKLTTTLQIIYMLKQDWHTRAQIANQIGISPDYVKVLIDSIKASGIRVNSRVGVNGGYYIPDTRIRVSKKLFPEEKS